MESTEKKHRAPMTTDVNASVKCRKRGTEELSEKKELSILSKRAGWEGESLTDVIDNIRSYYYPCIIY